MTPIPYADQAPPARSTVLTLGRFALRAYRGAPPPEPPTQRQAIKSVAHVSQGPNQAKAERYATRGTGTCAICGQEFTKFIDKQVVCSSEKCRKAAHAKHHRRYRARKKVAA